MDEIEEYVDERHKSWCIHCGNWIAGLDTNRDHVPSKCMLLKPYPSNLPVVAICKACNSSFSLDEEYVVALLSCVLTGTTEPDSQKIPFAKRCLRRSSKLRARIESGKSYKTLRGGQQILWQPEIERVQKVILKNARGHAFFEYGEPMLNEPVHVWGNALDSLTTEQKKDFYNLDAGGMWPEMGSRMMTRVLSSQDLRDGWIIVKDNIYKYAVLQRGGILVRSVLFDYLATEVYWS